MFNRKRMLSTRRRDRVKAKAERTKARGEKKDRRSKLKDHIRSIRKDDTKSKTEKKREIGANKAFHKGGMAGFGKYAVTVKDEKKTAKKSKSKGIFGAKSSRKEALRASLSRRFRGRIRGGRSSRR